MRKKSKKFIGWIIAFLMLFSGMCLETIETDSFFACNFTESNIFYVGTAKAVVLEPEECAIENIGEKGLLYVQQDVKQYTQNRKIQRNSLKLLRAEEVQLYSDFFSTAGYVQPLNQDRKTAVINYIHNQDGKK